MPRSNDTSADGAFTARLAERACTLHAGALPPDIVERTLDLVTDHVGVAIRGAREPWSRAVREQALSEAAAPAALLHGGGRSSARNAALVNGTAGHALELDDTHDRSLTHPGTVVISASLALAEATDAGAEALIEAIVAGYEVQCRIGNRIGQALIERGVHPTASLGVFGAAAAAGRLLGLDASAMASAFGIAASMSAGLMQFSQDPSGTMIKRLYGGLPAERGVLAAQLAQRGISAPRGSIEGEFGIARVLACTPFDEGEPFGAADELAIGEVSVKLYACCRNFHALIDAALACRNRRAPDAAGIERIDVYGPRAMIDHHLERRPRSTMAAQYSLPFTTAVALLSDPASPASYDERARDRDDLLAVADRVVAHHDPDYQAAFPVHFGGGIVIRYRDGSSVGERRLDSIGTPAQPVDRARIEAKFAAMTEPSLDPDRRDAVLTAIRSIASGDRLGALWRALDGATG